MLKAEYQGNEGFLQRDSVEHKGAQSTDRREGKERDGTSDLLEAIQPFALRSKQMVMFICAQP